MRQLKRPPPPPSSGNFYRVFSIPFISVVLLREIRRNFLTTDIVEILAIVDVICDASRSGWSNSCFALVHVGSFAIRVTLPKREGVIFTFEMHQIHGAPLEDPLSLGSGSEWREKVRLREETTVEIIGTRGVGRFGGCCPWLDEKVISVQIGLRSFSTPTRFLMHHARTQWF